MENIDKIFVINLKHRTDRLDLFMEDCKKMNIPQSKIEIFPAIYTKEKGCIGCALSHLLVLKLIKERGYKNAIIFEDDFTFIVDKNTLETEMVHFFKMNLDWRCLMLTYNYGGAQILEIGDPFIGRARNAHNASGYMVCSKYIDEFITCLQYAYDMLIRTGHDWLYVNDQYWKRLQDEKWFAFINRIGEQREMYSDLAYRVVKKE